MTTILITGGAGNVASALANKLSCNSVKFAFHDYSNWNQEDSQVHCCESDFKRIYIDENRQTKIIKYHNYFYF